MADNYGTPQVVWAQMDPSYERTLQYISPLLVDASGSSYFEQTITLPGGMTSPILSFVYVLQDASPENTARFEVQVTHGTVTTTLFSTNANSPSWIHKWVDLTPYIGQEITVSFCISMVQGKTPAYAFLDDVNIGSAYPDLWLRADYPLSAMPSSTITLGLSYGNQNNISAQGVTITATLPDKLTFVSADPIPTTVNGQVLTWDVGALAGHTGPFTIHVTATVAEDAVLLSTLNGSLQIATTSPELETANNTRPTHLFIGAKVLLPVILK